MTPFSCSTSETLFRSHFSNPTTTERTGGKKTADKNIHPAIQNRKARFEFEILDTVVAGIELLGSEVKSVRLGKASLNESFAIIHHGEVWLENMQITPYEFNHLDSLEPKRSRKLLLHKAEIAKLQSQISEKGWP